jgi:histidine triad (HIT) family protein
MSYDPNNVFGKILRGEIPSHTVYEDAHTLAFMDAFPQTDGHTLVIPKEGAENLFTLSPAMAAHLIQTTQKVARAVKAAMNAPGIMLCQFNGREAGQSVFHIHFHILPRFQGLELKFHHGAAGDPAILKAHAEAIRAQL